MGNLERGEKIGSRFSYSLSHNIDSTAYCFHKDHPQTWGLSDIFRLSVCYIRFVSHWRWVALLKLRTRIQVLQNLLGLRLNSNKSKLKILYRVYNWNIVYNILLIWQVGQTSWKHQLDFALKFFQLFSISSCYKNIF